MLIIILCALIANTVSYGTYHQNYYEGRTRERENQYNLSFPYSHHSNHKYKYDDEEFKKVLPGEGHFTGDVIKPLSEKSISFEHKGPPPTLSLTTVDVCASAGCMRGKVEKGRLRPYDAFYGIPYAEPPVGDLRLENPIPFKGWEGHLDATNSQSDCIQRNYFLYTGPIVGTENCLYLNVYRPQRRGFNKLPVFVWIHGGALNSFSSSPDKYGPEYLMDNGEVILVTLNYRLGMFGFLCSGDEAVKGNFGLKDQQLALKWVAANIEAFGGDPSSITLAGQSSGASSVQHHVMNPVSSALFHRAILFSGVSVAPWAFATDWTEKFLLSAKSIGIKNWDTASTYELAKAFKEQDAFNLILAFDELFDFSLVPPVPLRPCIEGDWEGAFLRDDPRKMWAKGKFSHKPILIGTTTEEGTFSSSHIMDHTQLKQFNENIEKYLPIQLDFDHKYVKDVIKFYLGNNSVDDTNINSYYQMVGDRTMYYPMINVVNQYIQYADVEKNPIFIYEFGFKSKYTFVKYYTGNDINLGVSNLDDLLYLFSMSAYFPLINPKSPEGVMSDIWVKTIVGFVTEDTPKAWIPIKPCNSYTNKPFCEYQVFKRYSKTYPDSVTISSSDQINQQMVDLWTRVDKGAEYINNTKSLNVEE